MGLRKNLSADGLINLVRHSVRKAKLKELNSDYSWQDCIMSGLAIFGFKCPSLLQFEKHVKEDKGLRRNLKSLYGVNNLPSDTTLRERLDVVEPSRVLRHPFKTIFAYLQRGKVLESYRYLDNHYIFSLDGTGQFSSEQVHCDNCCEKHHRDGTVSYYHHMLGAALVHPDHKVVIPLAPEPIVKGDGDTKNDCERNASKRLLTDLRREHPHLKILIVEDGLASNFPHLSLLDSLKMNYVIGVKPGDHKYLFNYISTLTPITYHQKDDKETEHTFQCYSSVPLNAVNHTYRVNVMVYTEKKASGKVQRFSWVTKIEITQKNAYEIMRAGRSRWRIENETFNTLKNQGYNFEHNYGHGEKNLCSVMTMLMLLAFMIDQVQQLCCRVYQKARKKIGPFSVLFERARSLIAYFAWESFHQLWEFIGDSDNRAPPPEMIR